MEKMWYACMLDNEDTDHGFGTFIYDAAINWLKKARAHGFSEAYIAVVDPKDDYCLEEIRDFEEETKC